MEAGKLGKAIPVEQGVGMYSFTALSIPSILCGLPPIPLSTSCRPSSLAFSQLAGHSPSTFSPVIVPSSRKRRRLVLKMEPSGLKKMALSTMHRTTVWDTGFLKGNFSLQIAPLLKEDAGIYEALVTYGRNIWHCKVKLGVLTGMWACNRTRLC